MSTTGVSGLVQFGGRPPTVEDEVINFLRREVEMGEAAPLAPAVSEGSWIRVISGCFRHSEGLVLGVNARSERVRVLLELLGREVQVSLSLRAIDSTLGRKADYPTGLISGSGDGGDGERRAAG